MSDTRYYYDLHCYHCGRFVKSDADSDTPYGNHFDIEPPPDRYYCELCAEKQYRLYASGGRVQEHFAYRKSRWQIEAEEFLEGLEAMLAKRMGVSS